MKLTPVQGVVLWTMQWILLVEVHATYFHGTPQYFFPPVAKSPRESNALPYYTENPGRPNRLQNRESFTIFRPLKAPQRRGGKTLNITLSRMESKTQSRIINNPGLYHQDRIDVPLNTDYEIPGTSLGGREDCICVPYYLCKDGVVLNSGGLHLGNQEDKETVRYRNLQNLTDTQSQVQLFVTIPQDSCGGLNVCCGPTTPPNDFKPPWLNYPVATPSPIPPEDNGLYPVGPTYWRESRCGERQAYGIHGRVQNLLYPTDVAEYGEYPWQAAILKKVAGEKSLYLCGGTLLSPNWVATAAHCLKHSRTTQLQVRLGEWDVHRRDEAYTHVDLDIAALVTHPQFSPVTLENDLALVRLRDAVDLSRLPQVSPACLPDPGQDFVGQRCWVSGWGKDSFGPQGEYQSVLKEVDLPVLSSKVCEAHLRNTQLGHYFRLYPGFLCAGGEPGKDACTGDGGSPLVCDSHGVWYVVGLVSWGIGCGQPGVPGVYVNMVYYKEWINSIILR